MPHTRYYAEKYEKDWGRSTLNSQCRLDKDCNGKGMIDACCGKTIILHPDTSSTLGKKYHEAFSIIGLTSKIDSATRYCLDKEVHDAHLENEGLYKMPGSNLILK